MILAVIVIGSLWAALIVLRYQMLKLQRQAMMSNRLKQMQLLPPISTQIRRWQRLATLILILVLWMIFMVAYGFALYFYSLYLIACLQKNYLAYATWKKQL